MSNDITTRSQANPTPLASSILSHGTAQLVILWPQTGPRLTLLGHLQFVVPSMAGLVRLGALTSQPQGVSVTGVEAEAPMTRAAQMILMMGGTSPVPGRLAQQR